MPQKPATTNSANIGSFKTTPCDVFVWYARIKMSLCNPKGCGPGMTVGPVVDLVLQVLVLIRLLDGFRGVAMMNSSTQVKNTAEQISSKVKYLSKRLGPRS